MKFLENLIVKVWKGSIFLICLVIISPLGIISEIERILTRGKLEVFFHMGGHFVSLIPGVIGNFFRRGFYVIALKSFHPTAMISFGTYFSKRDAIVRKWVGVGAYCILGKVDLGEHCRIASHSSVISGLHEHGNASKLGDREDDSGWETRVKIGEHSWVGEGARVGANVGSHAIVGLGAVVFREVKDSSLVIGNPARIVPIKGKAKENTEGKKTTTAPPSSNA